MKDFFSVIMDGQNGETIITSIRMSSVDAVGVNGRVVSVVVNNHETPFTFTVQDYVSAKALYNRIGSEIELHENAIRDDR